MKWWKTLTGRAFQLIFVWAAQLLLPQPANAEDGGIDLFSAETLSVTGDFRLRAADGEPSWVEGGFGKLRYGGSDDGALQVKPELAEAALVWQPRFTWSLAGTVVMVAQGARRTEAGLSEAYLSFKPLSDAPVRLSGRAGLMWPPVSLEHGGPEWAVIDTITPSAINSWIGEEVKVLGLEVTGKARLGEHDVSATVAAFDLNDTAATLLSFRGWTLHDRKTLAFRRMPLPRQNETFTLSQAPFTTPILDLDPGLFQRPGYYVRLAWDLPVPVRIEAFRYDNNAKPERVNNNFEWGWRTRFYNFGLTAELSADWQLRTQAMTGRTTMGFRTDGRHAVDTRFRSAYAMLTRKFGKSSISARAEAFDLSNSGAKLTREDDESGWAATLAGRRSICENLSLFAEYIHVDSRKVARGRDLLAPRQAQNQLQLAMRLRW